MQKVKILTIDPYHKVYGMLVPFLAQRLIESAEALGDNDNSVVPQFMSRLWARDPNVLLLAAIDSAGRVKGFTAAITEPNNQVILLQPRLDEPTENDAITEMVEIVEDWTRKRGFTELTLISKRLDPKWSKKYGFEVSRYILVKSLE